MSTIPKNKEIEKKVESYILEALEDEEFTKLVKKLKIDESEIKRNTTRLYDTLDELNNCKKCPNIYSCKNKVRGHVFFPENKGSKLFFSYIPCKYQKEENALLKEKNKEENMLLNASIKNIKVTTNRKDLLKWIKEFYKNYNPAIFSKGLYLHGNFGTGKTYIVAALINELKTKYNIRTEIIYFPELLRNLKENLYTVSDKLNYLENVDILLIDDLGAEKVTDWGRDEILGTILQTRMNKNMITFFTSNLTEDELLKHLSLTKDSEDLVKAKRILERIKYLTDDFELLGNNYRNQ